MRTFGTILDANKGIGKGFDTLRIVLAFSVIAWHCIPLTQGTAAYAKASFAWPLIYSILPMFFALSGFLVTGSALRLTIGKFALSRVLRIAPALVVDTLVTVLILGPLFTAVSLNEYFNDEKTYSYLLNMVGEIHMQLPGMFLSNPYSNVVNGSLWTIPPELGCYLMLAALIVLRWIKNWKLVALILALSLTAIFVARYSAEPLQAPGMNFLRKPGAKLIPFFLCGALFYLLRYKIVYSKLIFAACVAIALLTGLIDSTTWWESPIYIASTMAIYSYIVVFIGMTPLPTVPLFTRGDYSYGVYLYGFPIQQTIVQLSGTTNPYVLFFLTLIPVTALAMFSWHVIEKPTLRLRKSFSMTAKAEAERKAESAERPFKVPC
jgi:peptidoglycan/LPS O-acetylase OafA/YrhL